MDEVSLDSQDVRQNTCQRMVEYLRRHEDVEGGEAPQYTDDEFMSHVDSLDDNLIGLFYRTGQRDERQFLSLTNSRKAIMEAESFDWCQVEDVLEDAETGELEYYVRADVAETFTQVENMFAENENWAVEFAPTTTKSGDRLIDLYEAATKDEREAIKLMVQVGKYEDQGVPVPTAMRVQLSRLRKKTGFALDTTALRR